MKGSRIMQKIKYILTKQIKGLSVVYNIDIMEEGVYTKSIPTTFKSRIKAQNLVSLCNKYNVDPIHILDIMEDMHYNSKNKPHTYMLL